jgi:F-type H+-transporting ATPase subunit g
MAPPMQLSAWANAYSAIFARATNVGFWRDLLRTGGWVGLGVAVSPIHTILVNTDVCPSLYEPPSTLRSIPYPTSTTLSYINRNHQQTVEAYGIFSIGEMIGRRNIVGYKLKD